MTVRRIVTRNKTYDFNAPADDLASTRSLLVTKHLLRDAVLCNAVELTADVPSLNTLTVNSRSQLASIAKIEAETRGSRFAHLPNTPMVSPNEGAAKPRSQMQGGGALDRALITFAEPRADLRKVREANPRVIEMPFNSATKLMITVHRTASHGKEGASTVVTNGDAKADQPYLHPLMSPPSIRVATTMPTTQNGAESVSMASGPVGNASVDHSNYFTIVKGAPEIVIARCNTMLVEKPDGSGIEEQDLSVVGADEILRHAEELGGNGERLIAIAERKLSAADFPSDFVFKTNPPNFPVEKLAFVGLVSVMDPPRGDVAQAVTDCQNASIQVCMITGDHPSTAQAIARMVGIIRAAPEKVLTWAEAKRVPLPFGVDSHGHPLTPECACCGATCPCCPVSCTPCWARCTEPIANGYDTITCDDCQHCPCTAESTSAHAAQRQEAAAVARSLSLTNSAPQHRRANRLQNLALVVTGTELRDFTADDWQRVFRFEQLVFARTTPDQKLKIVTEAQAVGHIVAVTGDGVNDAPALKKADVGVAMGSATDVAQASADMVVQNNDFASIVRGIEQGRVVFDNLKKVVSYLLPAGSFSELMPVVVTIWFGAPTALSGFLMVIICIFTDVFASLALVHEPAESDLMLREPRDPARARLVDWKLILYAYGFIGVLESFAAFLVFGIFLSHNAGPAIANAINASGGADGQPIAPPSFGPSAWLFAFNEGAYALPAETLFQGQSIFFVVLVLCQIGNLLTTRTRVVPIIPMRWFGLTSKLYANTQRQPTNASVATPDVSIAVQQPTPSLMSVTRRRESRWVPIVVACTASIATAVLITEGAWVNVRPVPLVYWGGGVLAGVCIFLCGEARKFWFNLWPNGWVAKLAW